ncbi:peptidoglycan-associated lipoprotein [Ferrigenium kumadai]|uniref:Peptidoglycan-associated lipoprotein n=1 Tax=Ferrigenium kumadai TaxID=1682490 RepID=A0AAN1W029_9PROT|nr:peptidoglycan-associated lipoprotein Pal [Ferrigenium kumadai]BBJ00054.1 peptidoglycan-associated lipoprotein [Ferrigenium kumadai]
MKKIIISIVLVNLLAACASNKPAETTAAPAAAPAASATAAAPATQTAVDPLNDPASILAGRSVYYPFDVDAVQEADKPLVQAHGKYLAEHADRKVRLEGNCDERGSNEYNLGLGQRRADGVKKMLELSGAKAGQLSSVSYGEEKPKASGHDEASWKQNRRTDLNYAK